METEEIKSEVKSIFMYDATLIIPAYNEEETIEKIT